MPHPPVSTCLKHKWLDFLVLLAATALVAMIVCSLVSPNLSNAFELARQGTLEELHDAVMPGGAYAQAMRGYHLIVWAMVALIAYGVVRTRANAQALSSLSLVAAPACVLGMCLVASQSLSGALGARIDRGFSVLTPSQMDARQVWAALLWTRDQADMLPDWTRGGHEQWSLPGGDVLEVDVAQDRVSVRHPGIPSARECHRFASALNDMRPPSAHAAMVVVDGQPQSHLPCPEAGAAAFFIVAPLENRS